MQVLFLQIEILSWKGRQNNSTVPSIDHKVSMTMLSTDFHVLYAMLCLVNFQLSWKQNKHFNNYHLAKLHVQMQFLRVYNAWGLPMTEKLTELLDCMRRKEAIHSINHLQKRNGNPPVCVNHRGISLLVIVKY